MDPLPADLPLLDPKNDYVFKRLFADSPDLLAELISAVRHDEPPVQVLEVLNPQILPEELTGKAIELDVLARDATGRLFNIEVQVQRFPKWSARSTFYLSRLLSTQIRGGEHYTQLKPVVGIHLLDFDLFEAHPSALWHFEMRDRRHPDVRLGDELTLHVVELRKADRAIRKRSDPPEGSAVTGAPDDTIEPAASSPAFQSWIAFLKHWKETQAMSDLAYPPVQQAMKKLQDLSRNEDDRFRAIARERQQYNEATLLLDARDEGREEGLIQGKATTLTRLITRRFGAPPDWARQRLQAARPEQLDTWLDRILDASTLEDVFSGG